MEIILSHKIALNPNKAQESFFRKSCGTARFAYNWALAEWKRLYETGEKPSALGLNKALNSVKKTEFPWMYEVGKRSPQESIINLGDAFKRFFKKQGGYPRFKKRGIHDSFRVDDGIGIKIDGTKLKVPKLGWVRLREPLRFSGKIVQAVISLDVDRWFVAITVKIPEYSYSNENQAAVGVDLGIKKLATLSDGTSFELPQSIKQSREQIRRLQKSLHRKKNGSNNRNKARLKLAREYRRLRYIRNDCLHKLTHYLATNFKTIVIEDLNVSGMLKNRHLSRSISEIGFHEFRRQLEYKCSMYDSELVIADRFYPSSKLCSNCGTKNNDLKLSERSWTCESCGIVHDRDKNAAINLKNMAASSAVTACGAESAGGGQTAVVKLSAVNQEAHACGGGTNPRKCRGKHHKGSPRVRGRNECVRPHFPARPRKPTRAGAERCH